MDGGQESEEFAQPSWFTQLVREEAKVETGTQRRCWSRQIAPAQSHSEEREIHGYHIRVHTAGARLEGSQVAQFHFRVEQIGTSLISSLFKSRSVIFKFDNFCNSYLLN